jgi:hypothetical protein
MAGAFLMNYLSARPAIKSGDVMAWGHRRMKSWYDLKIMLVRLFTMSEYTHVGLAIVMGGRVWVLEAVTPKVRLVPLSNLLPCYHIAGSGISEDQIELGLAWIGREEIEYSEMEAVRSLFGLNDRTNGKIQCAEFVNIILGHDCPDTPTAVVEYRMKNGGILTELRE